MKETEKIMPLTKEDIKEFIEKARPCDDAFFQLMYDDKGACQELLRVVFEDNGLIVKDLQLQKSITSTGRGVRLDVICWMSDNSIRNVEIQKEDNDDHFRRIRYNASQITIRYTRKGTDFENIPDVYVIYIADFPLYEGMGLKATLDTVVHGKGIVIDDGLYRTVINMQAADKTSQLGRLMCHMKERDFTDDEFPEATRQMYKFKHTEEGEKVMAAVLQDYQPKWIKAARAEGYDEGISKGEEIGISKGEDKHAVWVYKNCMDRGMSEKDAIALSGISPETLASIKK